MNVDKLDKDDSHLSVSKLIESAMQAASAAVLDVLANSSKASSSKIALNASFQVNFYFMTHVQICDVCVNNN